MTHSPSVFHRHHSLTSKPQFLVTLLLLGLSLFFNNLYSQSNSSQTWSLSPQIQELLEKQLDKTDTVYDAKERMTSNQRTASAAVGHSAVTGTVHDVRGSLFYGVALLSSQKPERRQRGLDVIERILELQDKDPQSRSFGVWPYVAEEPLNKMPFVDYNWADFCGTELAMVMVMHQDLLSPQLKEKIRVGMENASAAIKKRNVAPDYTNITLLGTFQVLATAEMFNLPELKKYGMDRLKRFYDYTKTQGGFWEYNSPCYTIVSINALGRMRMVIKDPEARAMIEELYRLEWVEIANHFHSPSNQWAGPHSRCYSNFLSNQTLFVIEKGVGGQVKLTDTPLVSYDDFYIHHECPEDLKPLFGEIKAPREITSRFATTPVSHIGTSYLTPRMTLGSVNIGDFWNQRRQLIAYWGTPKQPSCFRVRVLHDGYDFAAAQFASAQKDNVVLAGINFSTNGGDTHLLFDRLKNSTFSAKDLRVRFEFSGTVAAAQKLTPPESLDKTFEATVAEMPVRIKLAHSVFGKEKLRWETGQDAKTSYIDLVIYSGEKRDFKLDEIGLTGVGFVVQIDGDAKTSLDVKSSLKDHMLSMNLGKLGVEFSLKPDQISALQQLVKTTK